MYIWGYQTPVFIPNLYDQVKKNSFLVKFFHFQGINVHLGVPNSNFYPHRVKKNFIFSEIFPFLGNKCTFGGTKLQFLSPSGQKNFFFSEVFPFLGNKCTFGGTKLQFLSPICTIRSLLVKKTNSFLVGSKKNFSIFREQMYIWGYQTPVIFYPILGNPKLQFLFPSGQENFIFSEIGSKKLQKNFIFSEIFPFLGNKFVHLEIFPFLGVPNSSFYPNRVKKT